MKNEKLVKPILFILMVIFMFIMSNSVITKGHDVIYDAKADTSYIINHIGYLKDGSTFSPIEEEHYITFYQDSRCSEFSLVFEEAPERDVDIEVWFMDDSGGILQQKTHKWKQNKHIFRIENIACDVKFVSLKIDTTFSIHQILGTNPYNSRKIQLLLFFVLSIISCVVVYLIPTKGIYLQFEKIVISFKEKTRFYICSMFVVVATVAISIGLSFVIGQGLSNAEISVNNYPISFNYRFIILLSTLISYTVLTIIFRKYIVKYFSVFTFLTIILIGFSFVLTESCFVGISWDDQIHYDWINYLSHFVDKKRTYAEWEMVDSYARYPWYKDKITGLYSYFDEYYKEGYFYLLEDFEFPFGKIVYSPMILGFMFARGLGLSFHVGFYSARMFEVLFAALIAAISVKRLKRGRIVILLVALIPTNMFLTSNLSYDTWVTSWFILGFSFLFAEKQELNKKIQFSSVIIIPVAFFLATITKQIYFVLAIPALFLSGKKFSDIIIFGKKENAIKLPEKLYKWIYRGLVTLSMVLPFVLMYISNISNAGEGDVRGGEGVNSAGQITYVLNNIPEYIVTLIKFLLKYLNVFRKDNSPFDLYGYEGVSGLNILVVIILLIGAFVDHSSKRKAFSWRFRILSLLIYIGVGALCATAMYVSFTPVGADYIAGCQQRYLLPVIFPTLYVLSRIPAKCKVRRLIGAANFYAILSILMVILDIYGMYKTIVVYY